MRSAPPGARLTAKDVDAIVSAIEALPFRTHPTWEHVRDAAFSVTRRSYTRQALSAHDAITTAYDAKVAEYRRFRDHGATPRAVEIEDDPRELRIRQLETDKAELQAKVVELDRRVMLHVANAIRLGVPTRELEKPTEKRWKGATDNKASKPRAVRSGKGAWMERRSGSILLGDRSIAGEGKRSLVGNVVTQSALEG